MLIFKNNLHTIILILIIIVGGFLRMYQLHDNPPGFFADEASVGYNAYKIATTGKDEHGAVLPVFFQAFGEYKGPIQTYLTVPFITLFGLSELAVRLPSAIIGSITILALFFLTRRIFHNHHYKIHVGLFAALLLAISPWHLHLSRTSMEGLMPFVLFTTLGLLFYLQKEQGKKLYLSILFFSFALYSYFPARIFLPLFGLSLVLLDLKFFLRRYKQTLIALTFLFVLILPLLFHLLSPAGLSRWQQVSVFSNLPKNESASTHIFRNYISHLSYDFLFKKGDIDMEGQFITRHSVRGIGELYLFQLPFILLGILFLFKINRKVFYILLFWILFFPFSSAFTADKSAQATRSIIGVIAFQIISAAGLVQLVYIFKQVVWRKLALSIGILTLIIVSFTHFINLYFIQYPTYAADFWGWQYGPKEIVAYFEKNKTQYDDLYLIGEFNAPEIFFKFYAPNGCEKCRIGVPHESYNPIKKQLFAVTPAYLEQHLEIQFAVRKTVYYPDHSVAFQIGEIVE